MVNALLHPSQLFGRYSGVNPYRSLRLSRNSSVERMVPLMALGMTVNQEPPILARARRCWVSGVVEVR